MTTCSASPGEMTSRPLLTPSLEFIADDELLEVTPRFLRVRKRLLKEPDRRRMGK